MRRGGVEFGTAFGAVALGVDDICGACDRIRVGGGKITREPWSMKHGKTKIAFVEDPAGARQLQRSARRFGSAFVVPSLIPSMIDSAL